MGNIMDEKTAKWLIQKKGMFSASVMYKLCPNKIEPKNKLSGAPTMFGQGAMTYIHQMARESRYAFNPDKWEGNYDMKRGKMLEPQATQIILATMGLTHDDVEYFGDSNPTFIKHDKHSGFSPDIIAKDRSFGVEIKCPSEDTHEDRLLKLVYPARKEGKAGDKLLKEHEFDYWVQCQTSIYMTKGAKCWFYADYNEFAPKSQQLILIRVDPEPMFQTDLRIRLKQASKLKEERIQLLNSIL